MNVTENIRQIAKKSKSVASNMIAMSSVKREKALYAIAGIIEAHVDEIIKANNIDLQEGKKNNLSASLLDRLELTPKRIANMVKSVRQVARQDDPIGMISKLSVQRKGFKVGKMRVPIGVVGIIYESRPNVTVEAAAICLKSGNTCILRGGSEAYNSNLLLVNLMQQALKNTKLDLHAIQFVNTTDREAVTAMLEAVNLIDVVIPRGGKNLVKLISDKAKVPVIKHLEGICHVYIDEFAKDKIAIDVAFNAKSYRYGICGAMETLLIHEKKVDSVMPDLVKKFLDNGVELVASEVIASKFNLPLASNKDWRTEYLSAKLSIKSVSSINEAIKHINTYGSNHTDSIVTDSLSNQNKFLKLVDSASVMVNTPSCFADGFEYGLGAEIGISTDKLHVRGPVGVLGLTTEKYIVIGNGEIRS